MKTLMVMLLAVGVAWAQATPAPADAASANAKTNVNAAPTLAEAAQVLAKQFGDNFQMFPGAAPMVGDFDGDGVEDLALVVRCEVPELNAASHSYHMFSPENEYFGGMYGAEPDTTGAKWQDHKLVAIIHGAGKEGWRAEQPKAKFLVANVPFDKLAVMHMKRKKRQFDALLAEETDVTSSLIYWDGKKKYKWTPTPMSLEDFK